MASLYLTENHPKSRRTVTVDECASSVWLYLSKAGSAEIEKDVWLYNLIETPLHSGDTEKVDEPPRASNEYIFEPGTLGSPTEQNFVFRWSDDGEAVSVWIFADLHAFILPESNRGYCRLIRRECPWGHPVDFIAYDKHLKS